MLDGSVMEIERCKGSNYCLILYVLQYWFKVILCVLTLNGHDIAPQLMFVLRNSRSLFHNIA